MGSDYIPPFDTNVITYPCKEPIRVITKSNAGVATLCLQIVPQVAFIKMINLILIKA